jgi:hypothetical protein
MFATSVSGNGNIGGWTDAGGQTGLAAADAVCQTRATAAGLTGTYKAWLSDTNNDAYCRLLNLTGKKSANCGQASLPTAAGPWVRTDGVAIASTLDQLTSQANNAAQVLVPAWLDENGAAIATNTTYFTGSSSDGTVNATYTSCADWTSNAAVSVPVGFSYATKGTWSHTLWTCANINRLLCFQTGTGGPLPSYTTTGKKAFVTSVAGGTGNLGSWPDAVAAGQSAGGLAAGDAICAARASAAGVSGTFKAWLSTAAVNAIDRFTSNGPWVRIDGVKIANDKTDLTDNALHTSLNQTETGDYITSYGVYTGTLAAGTAGTGHCNNWTDGTAGFTATVGMANTANASWTEYTSAWTCNNNVFRIYCLED